MNKESFKVYTSSSLFLFGRCKQTKAGKRRIDSNLSTLLTFLYYFPAPSYFFFFLLNSTSNSRFEKRKKVTEKHFKARLLELSCDFDRFHNRNIEKRWFCRINLSFVCICVIVLERRKRKSIRDWDLDMKTA